MGDVVCCLVSSRGMTKVSFRMAAWSLMGTLKEWLGGLGLVRRMGEEKGFFYVALPEVFEHVFYCIFAVPSFFFLIIYWLVVWNMSFIFPYIGNHHPNLAI